MKIPEWLPVYGGLSFRGECPKEDAELITFFDELKRHHPELYVVAIHPDNESKITGTGFNAHSRQKAKGATRKGAADILIVGCPTFVCELKRQDHTKSRWQNGQLEFLEASQNNGAFVCVALGYKAALRALDDWLNKQKQTR